MRNSASSDVTAAQTKFAHAPSVGIQRSTFRRDFNHRSTFDEGLLIPFVVDEVLPGDTIELNSTIVVRMSTPKFPIMSLLWLQTHFFFVPNRIIWSEWKRFQGEQNAVADDVTDHAVPQMPVPVGPGEWGEASIGDYFGLPTLVADISVNALPFRAYNQIWNDWYRDQDISDKAVVDLGPGPDTASDYPLQFRAKRHDYFTSARPWPLKGGVEVLVPLGAAAPVVGVGTAIPLWGSTGDAGDAALLHDGTNVPKWSGVRAAGTADWETTGLEADLSSATASTINDLRLAFTLQQALELDARSGTRYVEALAARWKVQSPDFRLQRAEYIGGGRQPINVTQVANQSRAASGTLGELGAYGYSIGGGHRASYTATEHGQLIGIVSIIGDNEYQEGLRRMWKRSTRFDFYEPIFANLGEQAILKGELFSSGLAADLETWAYQERWAEYRYFPSLVTGAFRSNAGTPLDSWHTAEQLGSIPPLSADFIYASSESPNIGRCLVVPTEPHFLFDSFTAFRNTRAMPVFSVPGLSRL